MRAKKPKFSIVLTSEARGTELFRTVIDPRFDLPNSDGKAHQVANHVILRQNDDGETEVFIWVNTTKSVNTGEPIAAFYVKVRKRDILLPKKGRRK